MPPRSGQINGRQIPHLTDVVQIVVQAESEDNQWFDWQTFLRLHEPVSVVANAWASAYGVPPKSVGLDDQEGQDLDLNRSPADYEWIPGTIVSLKAYPTEETLMESEEAAPQPAAPKKSVARKSAAPKSAAPKSVAPKPAAKERRQPSQKRKGSPSRGSATAEANGKRSVKPKKQPQQQQQQPPSQAKSTQNPLRSVAAASGGSKDDESIVFDNVNPKRAGTAAYERYEKYKAAKTWREARRLGAYRGDIQYDLTKGFARRG